MTITHKIYAWISFAIAAVAGLMVPAGALGYRWGWWGLVNGLDMAAWAGYAAVGAAAIGALVIVIPPYRAPWLPRLAALAAVAVGAAVLETAWVEGQIPYVRQIPIAASRIADISSDVGNPPTFMDLVAVRGDQPTPPSYGGADFARLQARHFPDIQPVRLRMTPDQAFVRARAVVEAMGWEIVAAVPDQGRIEAVAETRWFGFKDDVVIRVGYTDIGAKIDIRSKSRIVYNFSGDKGENARRVREFLRRVSA